MVKINIITYVDKVYFKSCILKSSGEILYNVSNAIYMLHSSVHWMLH